MWRVTDTAKAVFNVDNYKEYLSLQCASALRNIVRIYPYDVAPNVDTTGDGVADEGSLRGSSEDYLHLQQMCIRDSFYDSSWIGFSHNCIFTDNLFAQWPCNLHMLQLSSKPFRQRLYSCLLYTSIIVEYAKIIGFNPSVTIDE